ncbi:GAF domain-containing protein [Streptomyces sp. NPDC101227]|uniref:GAF domain-containing protein n=1 Tax=Streptomyces sp. NPDC101227 TaxID=3366136 RepID=UPI00380E5760
MTFDSDSGLHLPTADDELDQRIDLLRQLGLGDLDDEFDRFAAQLARDAGEPYAMVNLITHEQHFVGLHTPPGSEFPVVGRTMPRDHGYCPDVIARRKALPLPDVCAHPRFAGNAVVDKIGIRTYFGAPLIHQPTGTVLGTVCFVGTTPRPLSTGQASLQLIKERANTLMDLIHQRAPRIHCPRP